MAKEDQVTVKFPFGSISLDLPNLAVNKTEVNDGDQVLEQFELKLFGLGFSFRVPKKADITR